ncbi:uncharacterized protein N7515_003784 [Penicillium bovifimosum]|uniref:Uncharacterized protein n=1 Tax=Penicillium bovifimosum TaxID=126998 RepID=A0A9W9H752_9EURO|nr:uncharacterized protein N7515_003784 [Penicillium bovifimosum]KAJ5138936.1 hypothetical protein N7515_003784 [Penicillium bovifimosum]
MPSSGVPIPKRAAVDQPEERSSQQPRRPHRAMREFDRQDHDQTQPSMTFKQAQHSMAREEGFLGQLVHHWQNRCLLCLRAGRPHEHQLWDCADPRALNMRAEIARHDVGTVGGSTDDMPGGVFQNGTIREDMDDLLWAAAAFVPGVYAGAWVLSVPIAASAHSQWNTNYSSVAMMAFGPREPNSPADQVRKAWARRLHGFGVEMEDRDALLRYLGSKHGNEEVYKLAVEFLWLQRAW